MAKKRNLQELQSDHVDGLQGPQFTAEPVDTGNAHGNRSADAGPAGEPSVYLTPGSEAGLNAAASASRSEVVAQILDKVLKMKGDELVKFFSQMFPDSAGEDPAAAVNAQARNLATMKGNPGAVQPALDNGSVAYAASVNAAAGKTAVAQKDAQPAADPAGLTREEVAELLGGEKLSEEATAKIKTLFESAVAIKVKLIEAELIDEYQARLEEGVEEAIETIVEQVDLYVSEAAKEFVTENKLAMVDTARLAVNERFMVEFKNLLESHSIEVSEESVDIAEQAIVQAVAVEKSLEKANEKNRALTEELEKVQRALVLEKASIGLSLEGREKLKVLSESVAFENADAFAGKLAVLKEQRVNVAPKKSSVNGNDADRIAYLEEGKTVTPGVDPAVAALAAKMTQKLALDKYPL